MAGRPRNVPKENAFIENATATTTTVRKELWWLRVAAHNLLWQLLPKVQATKLLQQQHEQRNNRFAGALAIN